ncbi:sensor histidine kinase [Hymenobacter swuensis]|uniref:histidine kinase n=1 Tax=Hymenobacter swuensis DY53 TaxID=1227739 RepID=W8F691_9BACT|nr:sensor histidine kinase [Hymenobacter swuensis]AHJ98136.1 histidine kinase [Hymenobacter swuensis DY53]
MDKPKEIEFAWLLFAGIVTMLLLALAVIIFVIVHQRRVHALRLALQQQELAYQTKMLRSIITSQETERERIAQDLHDEIGASLSAARLFINQINYEDSTPAVQELAQQASQIVGDTLKSVRRIVQNMSPMALDKLGLCRAIKQLSSRLEATGLQIESQLDAAVEQLPAETQLALYRIIQEAFANALKHARATALTLYLHRNANELLLRISDDGCGFVLAQATAGTTDGMGLAGIAARVKLLEGNLHVNSLPGSGTHIVLRLPC